MVAATVLAAVAVVVAPLPPDAWGSIAFGCLGLTTAAALWSVGSPKSRHMLATVIAVASIRVGLALDARPAQIGALLIIGTAVGRRSLEVLRRTGV